MRLKFTLLVGLSVLLFCDTINAQIVSAFNARYQTNQKGGIVFLSNVSATCTTGTNCSTAKAETPPNGSFSNGSFTMNYIDIDGEASTFMSSSDSLNLANCSEILFAGLYWSARISSSTTNYSTRNRIKLKVNSNNYLTLIADNILDVPTIGGSSWSHPSYYCFKNITSIVSAAGIKGRFTIADLVTQTGSTNLWGGWSIVVVYKNVFESMRNLTVFDGFANVGIGNTLDIPISGFTTPPTGPVSFELGVIALDGDRDSNGDQLQFRGGSTFVNVSDGLHSSNNFFNSSITKFGVLTPFRNPSYNNTLGYDAGIFNPTNTALNYIGNNVSSATVRVTTSSENILTRVITSAIDVYEPDLRANVRINDINGGQVNPGDILEYTLVGKNIGSDASLETFMVDTLDPRTVYVPGSISIAFGPNSGAKTDVSGDDQAEYNSTTKTIKVRIGTGANASIGGQVNNSVSGADSTVIKFKVTIIDDCLMFQCDNTLDHKAYIFGEGNISGNNYNNNGDSDLYDLNGCPTTASNVLTINVTTCPAPTLASNGPICPGSTLNLTSQYSGNVSYNWTGPNGFTSLLQNPSISNVSTLNSGTYTINYTFPGLTCLINTAIAVTIFTPPIIQSSSFINPTCFNLTNGSASVTMSGAGPFTYLWSNNATTNSVTNLGAGTYTVTITNANNCTSIQSFTLTQPLILSASALVSTNYNGFNVSCLNSTNGAVTLTISGGTAPYSVLWSNGATTQNLSNVGAGTYTATITDSKGCTTNVSVALTQPTALQLSLTSQTNVSCFGGTNGALNVTLVGSVPTYSYLWSNNATTQDLTNLASGTYSLNSTDLNGCTTSGSYTLSQPIAPLSSSLTKVDIRCFGGNTASIDLTITGGTSPYTYSWSNGVTTQDLNNLVAGVYSVTITDSKGCQAANTVTINQPNAALSAVATGTNISCFGGSNGGINLAVSGGTSNYTYLWSNNATTQNVTGLIAGNYVVTVTDANLCVTTSAINLTQPNSSIQFNQVKTDITCFNAGNGSITLSPQGGTAPFTYTWSNSATTNGIMNLTPGTYTVSVIDANSCPFTNSYLISQPTELSSSAIVTNVDCFGGATGSINVSVSGATSPYSYVWSTGGTTEDLSGLISGNYTLSIQDGNACLLIENYTVTQTSTAVQVSISGTDLTCFENTSGSVSAVSTGGVAPYTYLWSTGATTTDILSLTIGNYTVISEDNLGCTGTNFVTISQPTALQLSAQITGINCFGEATGAINSTISGGTIPYAYLWSNGATTQDLNALTSGNYQLTITDANNCQRVGNYMLTEPLAGLSQTNSVTNVSCFGGNNASINVSTTGGTIPYSFSWNNGATSEDISGLTIGTYSLQTIDANGCGISLVQTITEPVILSENASVQNVLCNAGSTGGINSTIQGGTLPYTYLWNNGATTEDLSNLNIGSYTSQITDANGCVVTNNYTVTQPLQALQSSASSQNVTCFSGADGAIDLSVIGGTLPYTFSWNNSASSEDLIGLILGNYSVTITDANGCTTSNSVTINQPASPIQISSSPTNIACFGDATGAIDLTITGGTIPYSFSWSNGQTTEDLNNLTTGNYSISVTDPNNCAASTSIFVGQPSAPLSLSETHQDAVCLSTITGAIDLSVSGGTSNYVYSWDNGQTTQDISSLGEGLYTVTVTDAQQCQENLSIQIFDPINLMQLSENHSDVSCFGGSNGSLDLTVTGGNPVASYNWSNGAATQDLVNLSAGNYFVNVIDISGCDAFMAIIIAEPSAPVNANAQITNALCFGQNTGAINLTPIGGTSPYTFTWSTGETTEDIGTLTAGPYSAIITDSKGCIAIYNGVVNQANSLITVTSNQTNSSCFAGTNGSIDIAVSGGISPYSYSWSNGVTTEDLSNQPAGNYSITVQDGNGCSVSEIFNLTQPLSAVQATIVSQNITCRNGSNGEIQLTVTGGTPGYTYNWNNGAVTEDLSNLNAGQYAVLITDANGCTRSLFSQLTQPSSNLTGATQGTPVICHNGASGTALISAFGGIPPYSFSWNNGETTPLIDSLIAGNYAITVTDNNGCSVLLTQIINQPTPIFANTQNTNVICFGQASGAITSNVNGGVGPYTYSWNTGASTSSIQNLIAGPYFLNVTDANGCTTSFSDTIYQPSNSITLNAFVTNNICFGEALGAINLTTTGGTSPYQYLWNNSQTNEDLTNLLAGSYTVTVLDNNNCLFTELIPVGQPASGLSTQGIITNVLCKGENTGSINLQVSGPDGPFTYLWSNGATSEDISNLGAGIYTITVTNSQACSVNSAYNILEPATILAYSASVSNVSCHSGNDGAVDITLFGGTSPYTFSWSNGLGTEDISSQIAATYTVEITDANGCQLSKNETISEPLTPLSAIIIPTGVNCFNQSTGIADLQVSGGTPNYTFLWSNGTNSQDLVNVPQGFYNAVITDAENCTLQVNTTINQPNSALTVTTNLQNVGCIGTATGNIQLTVSGATPNYSYLWNTGATTSSISNLVAGNYTVTIQDALACFVNQSYTINQPISPLTVNGAITNSVCFNGLSGGIVIQATGGTAPYIYNWSNGATTANLNNIAAGNYTLTVTDANGCSVLESYTLTQPTPITVSTTPISVTCFAGNDGFVNATISGGILPYSLLWSNGATTEDIGTLIAGNYTLNITDGNGCITTQPATVSQPAFATSLAATITSATCFNTPTGSLDLMVNSATLGFTYSWNNGATTEDLANVGTGLYAVNVVDNNNCVTSATFSIGQATQLITTAALTTVNCFQGTDGAINLTVVGGVPPYSYLWATGETTEDLNNVAAGSYFITLIDANNCQHTASFSVGQPGDSLQVLANITGTNCAGFSDGKIILQVSAGSSPYSYSWSNGAITKDILNVTAGNYTVIITDINGCQITRTFVITEPLPLTSTFNTTNVLCFGNTTGIIDLEVSGGIEDYTYLWSNGATTQDIDTLSSNIYSVIITDANDCVLNSSTTISQPANNLSLQLTASNVSCYGFSDGSVDLTIQGGTLPYLINWNNGQITEDLTNTPSEIYSVTVSDSNACTFSDSINVVQPIAPLSVSNTQGNIACFNGNTGFIDLTVAGGTFPYSYNWSNSIVSQDNLNIPSGSYTVTITDASNCQLQASYTILQPASGMVLSGNIQNVSCFNGTNGAINLTVNGGYAPYSFNWSTAEITEDLNGIASGQYIVQVTDISNCIVADTFNVTQPLNPIAVIVGSTSISCFGGNNGAINITVSGGTSGYTFNWSNLEITEDLSNLTAGNYNVTITDQLGCTLNSIITLTEPTPFSLVFTQTNILCFGGNTGAINLTPSGGTPNYTYIWSNGSTSEDINSLPSGLYTVTARDANACTQTISTTITQPISALAITETHQNIICFGGNNGSIDIVVSGGTSPYTYLWNNGQTTEDIATLTAGTYSVVVRDVNLCPINLSVIITQPTQATTLTANVLSVKCFGNASGIIDLTVLGGTSPYTYNWNNGAYTTQDLYNVVAGIYNVVVTDANNCVSNATYTVSQPNTAFTAVTTSTPVTCYAGTNGSVGVTASGGTVPYTYLWGNGPTSPFQNGLTAGSYPVQVRDANGCIVNAIALVNQPEPLLADFTFDETTGCSPLTVNFTSLSQGTPSACLWDFGNGQTSTNCNLTDYTFTIPGCYTISLTINNGANCSSSMTMDSAICVLPNPSAVFNYTTAPDIFYTGEVEFNNLSIGADSYIWYFGDGSPNSNLENPDHIYPTQNDTSYTVTLIVADTNGCVDTVTNIITIDPDFYVYVPNTITVDGNLHNETFFPVFSDYSRIKRYRISIYNRWGENIWESTNYYDKWDGRANGKNIQDGVYTWKIDYELYNDGNRKLVGHVTVLR